ncbi:hypothetical protein NPIL_253461 [Nephila pilipes]|uniref:Uncharacterized protein n=1 Tax=Nephila pilipes TaxID=299642 RepID=A0A8X6NSK9_NEPPI|nr:hypothetical protein NPIL_253461 [Nephila pilipes]
MFPQQPVCSNGSRQRHGYASSGAGAYEAAPFFFAAVRRRGPWRLKAAAFLANTDKRLWRDTLPCGSTAVDDEEAALWYFAA